MSCLEIGKGVQSTDSNNTLIISVENISLIFLEYRVLYGSVFFSLLNTQFPTNFVKDAYLSIVFI